MNNNWVKFLIKDFLKSKLFWIFIIIISIFALIYSMKEVSYIKEALDFVNNSLKFKMGEVTLTPILILKYIFICSFLFWIAKKLVYIIKIIINNIPNIDNNSGVLLSKLVSILIYFFVFIISLKTIGIDVTAIAMFGSALGIGIGFSLQRVLSNFISGIIILSEKSLSKGDLVELEDGTRGFITDIKIRYTIITDYNNVQLIIPNEDFITKVIKNCTLLDTTFKITLNIGVCYKSDLRLVQNIILDSAKNHDAVSPNHDTVCYLSQFGDSSVDFTLMFWVKDIKQGTLKVKNDILFNIWDEFKKHNISIPYPHRQLYISKEEDKLL